jgi:hypothetical protein
MAYVAPSTVVAGQTYGAAAHNIIVNDIIDHEDRLDTVQNAQYPARNVLVNGAMQFAQRGTSVTGISGSAIASYYVADRWISQINVAGTTTQALSADAPTGSGFRNSLRVTCTTALTALSSTSYYQFNQRLEGQTLQHLKKGTSSAQQLTLSFWVKGSTTGTYVAALDDNDNTRYVAATYAINAANTWEQKTITFPADTTGALDNDNNISLILRFWLAAGSDFTGGSLPTSWGTVSGNNATGQTVNLVSAVNNYWQITGVQLEPGSQASPFEFVRYDDELRRCQRYFIRLGKAGINQHISGLGVSTGTTAATAWVQLPVTMRAAPSVAAFAGLTAYDWSASTFQGAITGLTSDAANSTTSNAHLTVTASTMVAGRLFGVRANNDATAYLDLTAEL